MESPPACSTPAQIAPDTHVIRQLSGEGLSAGRHARQLDGHHRRRARHRRLRPRRHP